jgi:glycosyltransferase involved in cell wall biosynthesis
MRKKVAIIDPLGAYGSSHHFYLFGQLKGVRNNDVNVRLYTNCHTEDPKIDGVKFYQSYGYLFSSNRIFIRGIKYILGSFLSIFHARLSNIKLFHFHIFHTNILVLVNFILVRILFGKVVVTVHDVTSFAKNEKPTLMSTLVYKLSDLILTHNQFCKDEIIKMDISLKEKIHIIPHLNYKPFINIQKDQKKSRNHLDLPNDKIILLFFGMIKKVKGLDVLLQSFRKAVDENPNIILLIAGKPWKDDFTAYQKIIDKKNLTEHVVLHTNFIPHELVKYYYCASDLVVLPYKKIYQSGVLMMALSYEKPVLVSNLAPFKEIIADNENGFVFKSEDIDDLANKLKIVLSNKANLERVRKNGSTFIMAEFNCNEIGRLTKQAYQTL